MPHPAIVGVIEPGTAIQIELPSFILCQTVIVGLVLRKDAHETGMIVSDCLVGIYKVRVNIIYDDICQVFKIIEDKEKNCASANKWFYICHIFFAG